MTSVDRSPNYNISNYQLQATSENVDRPRLSENETRFAGGAGGSRDGDSSVPRNEELYGFVTHNEEVLQRGVNGLVLGGCYQEHVCAEDFYKQPRSVFENIAIVEGATNSDAASRQESSVSETEGPRYVVENEVSWNGLKRAEVGGTSRYASLQPKQQSNVQAPPIPRRPVNTPKPQQLSISDTLNDNPNATTRDAQQPQSQRRGSTSAKKPEDENPRSPTPPARVPGPGPPANALLPASREDMEAIGRHVMEQIQSSSGRRVLFELFDLAHVADNRTFVLEVLEKFRSERNGLWKKMESQGYEPSKYKESDDEIFLQISYMESSMEAIKSEDWSRAERLLEKAWGIATRRLRDSSLSAETQGLWIIELHEVRLLSLYVELKTYAGSSSLALNEFEQKYHLRVGSQSSSEPRWLVQYYYLLTMLAELDKRYIGMQDIPLVPNRGSETTNIEILEMLRYGAERLVDEPGELTFYQNYAKSLPLLEFYKLATMGHQEMIVQNLCSAYNYQKAESLPVLDETPPPRSWSDTPVSSSSRTEDSSQRSALQNRSTFDHVRNFSRNIISPTSLPPAYTRQRSRSECAPYSETLSVRVPLVEPEPLYIREMYTKKPRENVYLNSSDQPLRNHNDCTLDELRTMEEFWAAASSSTDLDLYEAVAAISSLQLINYVRLCAQNGNQMTPLIHCIQRLRYGAAKSLIQLGAAFKLGYPLHIAIDQHCSSRFRYEIRINATQAIKEIGQAPSVEYFSDLSYSFIKFMINEWSEVDVNTMGMVNKVWTSTTYPLHIAAADLTSIGVAKLLLDAGADVFKWNSDGYAPLDIAQRGDNPAMVVILQEKMTEITGTQYGFRQ